MTERATTMGPANTDAEAQLQLTKVSDSICDAQSYLSGTNKVAVSAATSSSITCYSDTSGNTLRNVAYRCSSSSPAALEQTQNNLCHDYNGAFERRNFTPVHLLQRNRSGL